MSAVKFIFPREVPRFKWNGSGVLEDSGVFTKGVEVMLTSAIEKFVPGGKKVMTFEVWENGNPYYFDPTETGVSRYTIKFLTQELRTYRLKKAIS